MEPGELLRELRLCRGVSQNHLAEQSRIGQSVISRLERGADARWSTWKRLLSALGYDAMITAETAEGEDDIEDLLQDGIQQRRERIEEGRAARW
ncbi:MAG: helix-turn-helix domain-containing protein [Elusimicrobiota bacterium]